MTEQRRWHDWKPIIDAAKDREDKEALIKQALAEPYVKRKDGMLYQSNTSGRPHDCMSQVDMAEVLLRFGVKFGSDAHLRDGEKCIAAVTTKVSNGGLRKTTSGADVAWFHGMTSQGALTPGWTLNKHIHAVRGLLECASVIRAGDPSDADDWTKYALRGLRQLDIGEPKLKTYIVGDDPRSWLYYSLDQDGKDGRFLVKPANPEKNGGYHLYCMAQLEKIDRLTGGTFGWGGLRGEFDTILKAYKLKLREGLYVDSKACTGGNFKALADSKLPLEESVMAWWNARTS